MTNLQELSKSIHILELLKRICDLFMSSSVNVLAESENYLKAIKCMMPELMSMNNNEVRINSNDCVIVINGIFKPTFDTGSINASVLAKYIKRFDLSNIWSIGYSKLNIPSAQHLSTPPTTVSVSVSQLRIVIDSMLNHVMHLRERFDQNISFLITQIPLQKSFILKVSVLKKLIEKKFNLRYTNLNAAGFQIAFIFAIYISINLENLMRHKSLHSSMEELDKQLRLQKFQKKKFLDSIDIDSLNSY